MFFSFSFQAPTTPRYEFLLFSPCVLTTGVFGIPSDDVWGGWLVWGTDDLGNIPPDLSSRGRAGMDNEEIFGFSGFILG